MRRFIKAPLAILAEGAEGGLVVEDGRIAALVPAGAAPPHDIDETFDASSHVVLPGLINTHHHFYQTLTRAFPPALNRELFPWLTALYPVWARLDPEKLALAATTAMAELMLSGCTTTTDHHYLFPAGLDGAIDIEIAAAERLGMRVVMTRGSMNLSQKDGGLPPDHVVQDADAILADSARLLAAHHDPSPHAMVQIALAPCSPFSVTRDLMKESATLARAHGARLHTHLAETLDEEDFCVARFGMRPVDYLEDVGWLADDVWLAHGIHFPPADQQRLAKAGVGITHCACSNMILGSGHCPVHALEAAGCPVGLGVDGSASQDASNLMQEVRHAFLLQRHHYGVTSISHLDALRWATVGSARCIGRADALGRIDVGMAADLALFTLDELRFAGHGDPIAALVNCGAHRADRVMIAGRWTVIDGTLIGLDIPRLIADQQAAARALQA
ncbi:8-oxoguanine deaminase [Acuticoccus kandeliae]|uniref:8-oxoguanine deaminase n=1 Tax=Acuticoccus kandeliae TaxID=2073160 RepID=UPI000D3E8F69|nr:8-oxoguanine deaminase [Acuticoccus kandeliae]